MADDPFEWDVFISHASEDKDDFVRPLAKLLERFGLRVWYDEFSLGVGDSLSRSIDKGLGHSRYGIAVISPAFIEKGWPEYELRGLIAREVEGSKVILPVWHNVTREEVAAFSLPLVDKVAVDSSSCSLVEVAIQLVGVIRPELREALHRIAVFEQTIRKAPVRVVSTEALEFGPIRHESLPDALLIRIKEIHRTFAEVFPVSLADTIDNFRRDLRPTHEVEIWERIASAYKDLVCGDVVPTHQEDIFAALLALSTGLPPERVLEMDESLSPDVLTTAANALSNVVPRY